MVTSGMYVMRCTKTLHVHAVWVAAALMPQYVLRCVKRKFDEIHKSVVPSLPAVNFEVRDVIVYEL